jgi:uncharacterized membrane protein required for colicin V production
MQFSIGIIIDLVLVAILAIILFVNTKRGFLYAITVLTGNFVSLILAFFLSKYVSFIFERPVNAIWEKAGEVAKKLPWVADVICVVLAFILCVLVVRLVFKIIAMATSGIDGKLGKLNHFLGFVLGIVIAFVAVQLIAVAVYLVGFVLSMVVPEIGYQLTNGARFTRWVYDHNVLIGLLKSILGSVLNVAGNAMSSIG